MIEIENKQVMLLCEGGKGFDSSLYIVAASRIFLKRSLTNLN